MRTRKHFNGHDPRNTGHLRASAIVRKSRLHASFKAETRVRIPVGTPIFVVQDDYEMTLDQEPILKIDVSKTTRNRAYWLQQDFAPERIQNNSQRLRAIVLPWTDFRENTDVTFPQGTTQYFKFLTSQITQFEIDILSNANQYSEVALHSREFRLPLIFVTHLVFPVVAAVTASYLSDRLLGESDDRVLSSFIIECASGDSIQIEYQGPLNQFHDRVMSEYENWCNIGGSDDSSHKNKQNDH